MTGIAPSRFFLQKQTIIYLRSRQTAGMAVNPCPLPAIQARRRSGQGTISRACSSSLRISPRLAMPFSISSGLDSEKAKRPVFLPLPLTRNQDVSKATVLWLQQYLPGIYLRKVTQIRSSSGCVQLTFRKIFLCSQALHPVSFILRSK